MTMTLSEFGTVEQAVHERLSQNKRLRRNLPAGGRLRIDRQLPFLCVYRSPPDSDDAGTQELITTEAAYLFASGDAGYHEELSRLCGGIASVMQEHFGVFLFLEVWADRKFDADVDFALQPRFRIVTAEPDSLPTVVGTLKTALERIHIRGRTANVEVEETAVVAPPGMPPLEPHCERGGAAYCVVGLAVHPVYRNPRTGVLFPMVLETLRRQLAPAIRRTVHAFAGGATDEVETHFEEFGPTALVQAAKLVDEQLCEVADSFDFLLQVTPVNAEQAWREFRESGYKREPVLHYRPLPYHPSQLKRKLFEIPIERVEDTTLAHLFWEKQEELDRQLSALRDLDTPAFLYDSINLYGGVDDKLFELADQLLAELPTGAVRDGAVRGYVKSGEVMSRAREEIAHYRRLEPSFEAQVELCDHIASGIMVSHDRLLVSDSIRLRQARVEPLLHHEVGTHLLTYFNGRKQPFRQLASGLAGYETLQEGLAVLAEYLAGGLTVGRLRTLAGRVIAVRSLIDGASFVETYQRLRKRYRFTKRRSFTITLRAYRAGGLTKDAIYLRGLRDLLDYLHRGHEVEPLYVGKIALQHVPFVQELRRRGVIQPPAVLPRLWEREADVQSRLRRIRGSSILELVRPE